MFSEIDKLKAKLDSQLFIELIKEAVEQSFTMYFSALGVKI